jgi:glycosyltransferase involved in cell wall biosynthesis
MTKAICIPFHRYQPHTTDRYRIFFDQFKKTVAKIGEYVDALYLIDSDFNFTEDDIHFLNKTFKKVVIIHRAGNGSHWDNLRKAAKTISEDFVLFMDQDTLIFDNEVIKEWFNYAGLAGVDCYTAFDGSGGLLEFIEERYPVLEGNARMGTYFFILSRRALSLMTHTNLAPIRFGDGAYIRELGVIAKDDDWLDSFGYFTLRLLYNNFKMERIADPRESLYFEDTGIIEHGVYHDDKHYHIRNGNLPIYLLECLDGDKMDDFNHCIEITPRRELMRLMAWYQYMKGDETDTLKILPYIDVPKGEWDVYLARFKEFHHV